MEEEQSSEEGHRPLSKRHTSSISASTSALSWLKFAALVVGGGSDDAGVERRFLTTVWTDVSTSRAMRVSSGRWMIPGKKSREKQGG